MEHIIERKRQIAEQIFKSYKSDTDYLEKGGKRATIGEVRTWGSEKWVKHQDGWVHVHPKTGKATLERPGGKRETASEDHTKHYKEHIDRHDRESLTKQGQKQAELMDEGYSEVDADRIANGKKSISGKETVDRSKDGSVLNATLKTDSDVEDMKKIADTKSGDKKVEEKKKIETDEQGIHSVEHKGSKYWSKPGESKEDYKTRVKKTIKEDNKDDIKFEDDEKKDKSLDKYKALGDRKKLEVDGVTYKLELIKHPKDRYDYDSQPTFSVKLTHPSTGEIKVMPNAIKFHSGYDQGPGASSKQQWYADVAGYGTGNGGGQSSTSSVYVNRNQREHLAELFSSKKHYQESYHKHQDSIVTFPKGTKTEEIKRGLDNY